MEGVGAMFDEVLGSQGVGTGTGEVGKVGIARW